MKMVLIPAYEPDEKLIELVDSLHQEGFGILVVNDGSSAPHNWVFEQIKQKATVLVHSCNQGKGAALKTGLRYIRDCLPECEGVITCDGDGQHKPADVVRVGQRLQQGHKFVLTVRQCHGHGVPLRSRFGNGLSRVVYALLTSRYLPDNQSGLRGFHKDHFDWLLQVEKNKYDYEMNVLYLAAKKNIYIDMIPIEAVYIDNNSCSHFNPVQDTLRIYRSLFRLAVSTWIALLVAQVAVFCISWLLEYSLLLVTLPSVGGLTFLVTVLLNQTVFLKSYRGDCWITLIYTVISYFVYTLGCALFAGTGLSLFVAFNVVYGMCLPVRYYFHKFIFVATRKKE